MNAVIKKIEDAQIIRKNVPFKVGDTVKVSLRIKEGEKESIQVYEGVVTCIQSRGAKMQLHGPEDFLRCGSGKDILYQSPMIKEVKSIRSGKVRRAKLFYLRGKFNKKDARIQESKKALQVPSEGASETAAQAPVDPAVVEAPAAEAEKK